MKSKWHTSNDIVLALIIIIAAAVIILWRFNILIQYPDKVARDNTKREIEMKEDENKETASASTPIKMGSAFKDGKLKDNVNITILDGSDEAAFKDLFDKKLFDNYDQFKEALDALKLSPDMVRKGTMGLTKGSSVETVLRDLTTT